MHYSLNSCTAISFIYCAGLYHRLNIPPLYLLFRKTENSRLSNLPVWYVCCNYWWWSECRVFDGCMPKHSLLGYLIQFVFIHSTFWNQSFHKWNLYYLWWYLVGVVVGGGLCWMKHNRLGCHFNGRVNIIENIFHYITISKLYFWLKYN